MKDLLLRRSINAIASPAVAWQRHHNRLRPAGAFPRCVKSIQHANASHTSKVDRNYERRKSIRQIGRHFSFILSRRATQVTQCGALRARRAAFAPCGTAIEALSKSGTQCNKSNRDKPREGKKAISTLAVVMRDC
jgi:hypothetical protein